MTRPLHQSQLPPPKNKFHVGNGADGKHYWLTPQWLWDRLKVLYDILPEHDMAPYPKPDWFNGLRARWPKKAYINPPFGSVIDDDGKKKGMTAWVRKALAEWSSGNTETVVMVYPIDKWILMLIEAGAVITNLRDVRWLATEDGSEGKGTGRHIAEFALRPLDERIAHLEVKLEELRANTGRRPPMTEAETVVLALLRWAESKCPCENEQPNPCPICGASVEGLEGCKAADNTLPPSLLAAARNVKRSVLSKGASD